MSIETRSWVALTVAIIGFAGMILAHNLDRILPPDEEEPTLDIKQPESTPPPPAAIGFGSWEQLVADVTYKAESDGFVVAYTGGNRPAENISFLVGLTASDVKSVTRASKWNGSASPVPKGHYWRVQRRNGQGSATVYWLPLGLNSNESSN